MRLLTVLLTVLLVGPVHAASLLVVSQAAATLTEMDGAGWAARTLTLAKAPAAIVAAPGGRQAFVSHPELGAVSIVDLAAWQVERVVKTGGQPFGLALAGEDRLLVTDWSANALHMVDLRSDAIRSLAVGRSPSAVVVAPDGRLAYTIDRESDAVSIVDLDAWTVTGTIGVGRAPFAAALTPDGTQLLVANVQSGDLSLLDTREHVERARIPIGGMPYGVAVDAMSGTALVTDQESGKLALVDLASRSVTARLPVGDYSEGVVVLDPGSRAAVANWFSDDVALVDLEQRAATHVAVPAGPRMLAVVPEQEGVAP